MDKEKQRKLALYQKQMKDNPTPAEQAVKDALDHLGIAYRFQKGFLRGKTVRIVDFYIAKLDGVKMRLVIEVDGGYHDNQKEYDEYREKTIKFQRYWELRFLRLKNEWVLSQADLPSALLPLIVQYKSIKAVHSRDSTYISKPRVNR